MASSTESLQSETSTTAPSQLDKLVSHLLASKRSLSSINHVYRANELVTSTRKALETSIIISARTEFIRSGIDSQCIVLAKVRSNTEGIAMESASEFATMIRNLDAADERLRATLDLLRETMIEASLRPEGEERRSLLDFVDETGVAGLVTTIKESIDTAGRAHDEFKETNAMFDEDLQAVKNLLRNRQKHDIMSSSNGDGFSPIPDILQEMEDRAKDMADNLESLVKHFDLCVTAIKHTEGGGDAAQRLAGDLPDGMDIGQGTVNTPADPIGDEEKIEMMEILEKDAGQVEDVVMEIKDHISEMESQYEIVTAYTEQLKEEHEGTTCAFGLLENIGLKLPAYITQSHLFVMRWDDEKIKVEEHLEELEGLRLFYDGFLKAYDNLLIEIDRRKTLELKAEKVAQEAMMRIQKLYEADVEERDAFKREQGEFLPGDIWPGLTAAPLKYQIVPVGDDRVPDVTKPVLQEARRRVSGRGLTMQ